MSESTKLDLLFSTIAVVFEPIQNVPAFRITDEILTDILRHPLNLGNAPGGQIVISSPRDDIEVQISPNKIDVRDLSGSIEHGQTEIPRVVNAFISLLQNPTLISYGINLVVEVVNENPAQWLAKNLLHPDMNEHFGDNVSSNQISLMFSNSDKDVTLQIGSRVRNYLNMNFNASENTNVLPNVNILSEQLAEQYQYLDSTLRQLGAI